ncbi:unnamed protein product (macronuclear) [Paramecium tetraurelia]|uniref:Uncharacterized protein n=1 Tax=Paramecium tetraurelia TaxID=5888 RepID=A0CY01_PARTE|nr:uncharacterized protein GSPATT00011300001 [Paramecium tetraurelia]CAK75668.1 unnamed protein product [Paramecium tetraurelia]|eukprot:XP_001443065.1 hypothetical protein (macronuclear) [Paramecium tetraurelia strain d4-2]
MNNQKLHVKQSLVKLTLQRISKERRETFLNQIIQVIVKYDFPGKFQDLENYFISTLQQISQFDNVVSHPIYDFVRTLKSVQKEVSKNRLKFQWPLKSCKKSLAKRFYPCLHIYGNMQPNYNFKIYQKVLKLLVMYCFKRLPKNQIKYQAIQLCHFIKRKTCKKINIFRQTISDIFKVLLQKATEFLKVHQNSEIIKAHLKTLISSLASLQQLYPISIGYSLQDYLTILQIILHQVEPENRLINIGLASLTKILQTHFYYCSNEQFKATIPQPKSQVYIQLREVFFNTHIIFFLERLIVINSSKRNSNIKEILEIEHDSKSKTNDDKDEVSESTQILCAECQEQLISRFPQQILSYIIENTQQLISTNYSVIKTELLDSFFSLFGKAIKIQEKQKLQTFSFMPILNYLFQTENPRNYYRYIMLGKEFISKFSQSEFEQFFEQTTLIILKSDDIAIKIAGLDCINQAFAIKVNRIDQTTLIKLGQIVSVLPNVLKEDEISHYIQIINDFLYHFMYGSLVISTDFVINQLLQNDCLIILFNIKTNLLVVNFCELFKKLLISFPFGNVPDQLIQLAIIFITQNMQSNHQDILDLYLKLLYEYNKGVNHNTTGILLQELFLKNENMLLQNLENQSIKCFILLMINEMILLDLLPISNNLYQMLASLMIKAQTISDIEQSVEMKNNCLNVLETIILQQIGKIDVTCYGTLIIYLIKEFLGFQQIQLKSFQFVELKTRVTNILNIFFFKEEAYFLEFIASNFQNYDQYFIQWQENSINIINKGNKKLNTITTLYFLKYISQPTLQSFIEPILKESLVEIQYFIDYQNEEFREQQIKNRLQYHSFEKVRLSKNRESLRKEELFERNLHYNKLNIQQLVLATINQVMTQFKLQGMQQIIQDQYLLGQLNLLVDEC